jgi:hypothetical protein
MFRRFAAASAIACILIAIVVTVLSLVAPADQLPRLFPVLRIWCVLPALWGVWAMLTPRAWMPKRLPWWGVILGALLGSGVMVLNLPEQVLGQPFPVLARAVGVVVIAVVYYLLWMLVRMSWRALGTPPL